MVGSILQELGKKYFNCKAELELDKDQFRSSLPLFASDVNDDTIDVKGARNKYPW